MVYNDKAKIKTAPTEVRYVGGDLTADRAQVLVNTVNCKLSESGRGVMGAGLAKAFKDRFPSIMPAYEAAIRDGSLKAGKCVLFDLPDGRKWAALGTKDEWRNPSKMEWVDSGLKDLGAKMRAADLRSVALAPPGCGNGGLEWAKVEPLVHKHLEGLAMSLYAEPSPAYAKARDRSLDAVSSRLRTSTELAKTFASASQADRIADPELKSAAKVVAISYAHIDAAFKPGSLQNLKAKTMLIDVMAANIAQGRSYDKPKIARVSPAQVQEIRKAAVNSADQGLSR